MSNYQQNDNLVASRIAALMLLSDAAYVSTAPSDQELNIDQILGTFAVYEDSHRVAREDIQEVLSTGLYAPALDDRVVWSHRSFAEYLAADYLLRRKVTTNQVIGLVSHKLEVGRVAPQLAGVAGWLAALSTEARRILLVRNPEILLETDATLIDESDRPTYVASLLQSISEGRASAKSLRSNFLIRLWHPNLGQQLAPYLSKATLEETRHAAVFFVRACHVMDSTDLLLKIAIDDSETFRIRREAIATVIAVGDRKKVAAALRPIATSPAVHGRDALELKAAALQALWPEEMSSDQLGEVVSRDIPDPSFIGRYYHFLTQLVPEKIPTEDLPQFYRWVTSRPRTMPVAQAVLVMIDGVLRKGLLHLENNEIAQELARAVFARITVDKAILGGSGRPTFAGQLAQMDPRQRQPLLEGLITTVMSCNPVTKANEDSPIPPVVLSLYEVVNWTDFDYLRRCYLKCEDQRKREVTAWLMSLAWNPNDPESFNTILEMVQEDGMLRAIFKRKYEAITLKSNDADYLRQAWDLQIRQHNDKERQRNLAISRVAHIPKLLDRIEAGDTSAWVEVSDCLTDWQQGFQIIDLPEMPFWNLLSSDVVARVEHAAKTYISEASLPEPADGNQLTSPEALAAYRALKLVATQAGGPLKTSKSTAIWAKWANLIVCSPFAHNDEGNIAEWLRETIFELAPAVAGRSLSRLLRAEGSSSHVNSMLARFKTVQSTGLTDFLASEVETGKIRSDHLCTVLVELFRRKSSRVEALCLSLIAHYKAAMKDAVAGGVALIMEQRGTAWRLLWNDPSYDRAFLRRVFVCLVRTEGGGSLLLGLTTQEIAEFYKWVEHLFPSTRYLQSVTGEYFTDRSQIAQFRDSLPHVIANSGEPESIKVLRSLAEQHPNQHWIAPLVRVARETVLERSWVPIPVQDLVKVLADSSMRYVASPSQFLDVLVESLDRLNAEFQGTPPSAPFLWDTVAVAPKEEELLSDYVVLHLRRDLRDRNIIANREVQFTRGMGDGGAPGERTDVLAELSCSSTPEQEPLRVVIEIKGCWNAEVKTAMETQLLDRYLAHPDQNIGLYVVGWYLCPQWSDKKKAKTRCQTLGSPEDCVDLFKKQAHMLSQHGKLIRAYVLDIRLR